MTAFKSVLYREFLTKRSDIKEIARPQNGTSRIQSAVAHIFNVYVMKLGNFSTLNKHVEIERPQIEFLKFHFQGGQFLLYHFFWLRIHGILTWKRSIIPNVWVLVKTSLFLLTQNIIQIVVLSTFEELTGTITSYITNITVNFPSKPSKIFPCVSVGMWNHWLHCWICFLQLLLNFIHSGHELTDFLAKRKPN